MDKDIFVSLVKNSAVSVVSVIVLGLVLFLFLLVKKNIDVGLGNENSKLDSGNEIRILDVKSIEGVKLILVKSGKNSMIVSVSDKKNVTKISDLISPKSDNINKDLSVLELKDSPSKEAELKEELYRPAKFEGENNI